jgi:hypothetical protein
MIFIFFNRVLPVFLVLPSIGAIAEAVSIINALSNLNLEVIRKLFLMIHCFCCCFISLFLLIR